MSHLSVLSNEKILFLASIPYKAGLWVSYAEDEEGENDDRKEMQALKACLKHIVKKQDEGSFVHTIFQKTLASESLWDSWADDAFHVAKQARNAMQMLRDKSFDDKVMKSYRAAVMEVGYAVAQAYGEFGDWDDEPDEGFFEKMMGRVVETFSGLTDQDQGHPTNISPAEDSALSKLSAALKVGDSA